MAHTEMKIELSIWNENACLKIVKNDDYKWFYQKIGQPAENYRDIIYNWLLSKLKHAFYQMPVDSIKVNHSK